MAAASHDEPLYLGIDVGTGSARAALFSASGALLGAHARATTTFRSPADARVFEQSTDDIWACIAECSRAVLRDAHAAPARVKGVGFDATCSLAVVDGAGSPVAVSPTPQGWAHGTQNVILWADHRAEQEAHEINASRSRVLDFVGGTMSLEMELPKILHLARRMPPALFAQCHFYDLPDFLTWRATGSRARSHCSLVCKCAYVPPGVVADGGSSGWQPDLLRQLGLGQLVDEGYARLGGAPDGDGVILTAGQPVAQGLTAQAAAELGLLPGTAVGSALIDAYAGWVGTVAAPATNGPSAAAAVAAGLEASEGRLAAIAGTSTCHVLQSTQGIKVKGVWGPYKNAVFPGMWMNEGGQSSTGQLIDFMIDSHPASPALKAACASAGTSVFEALHAQLDAQRLAAGVAHDSYLTTHLHLYPDLHGNRSPLADPSMRGLLDGLALDASVHDLARVYFATLEAIALQTRQIITALRQEGHRIDALYMSGGHTRNLVFMQLLADVCAIPVQLPASSSTSVVLGAAMLGRFAHETSDGAALESQAAAEAHAHKHADRLWHTMVDMSKPGTFVFPSGDAALTRLLDAKYAIFLDAIATQRRWRAAMDAAVQPLPAAAA